MCFVERGLRRKACRRQRGAGNDRGGTQTRSNLAYFKEYITSHHGHLARQKGHVFIHRFQPVTENNLWGIAGTRTNSQEMRRHR